jgi:hypothetical protein
MTGRQTVNEQVVYSLLFNFLTALRETWNGTMTGGHLTYAAPDHPEYRRYPIDNLIVVYPEAST